MSRAPHFSRQRSTSTSNNNPPGVAPMSATVRPLQINRPSTPGNASPRHIPTTSQLGPSRPQRSELRNRHLEQDRISSSSREPIRDSSSTTHSDAPAIQPNGSPTSRARPNPQRMTSQDSELASPAALSSVVSAFQSAGSRRRAMTNGSDEVEFERVRRQELEDDKRRQQRIRERVPGRKATGRANTGDIDGMSSPGST